MVYFLLNLASFNLFLILLFFFRKLFNAQIAPLYQRKYWQLVALGLLHFVPNYQIPNFGDLIYYRIKEVVPPKLQQKNSQEMIDHSSDGWLNDNFLPSNDFLRIVLVMLFILWVSGIIFFFVRSLRTYAQLRTLIREADLVDEERVYTQLERAKACLEINRKEIVILQSNLMCSPATSGIFNSRIILPRQFVKRASDEQLYFILLHELVHQKNKDTLQNYFLMGITILNWFNPISWFIMKQARNDREISCDQKVLRLLDDEDIFFYGSTLLDCANSDENSYLLSFSAKCKELKKRIELISNFKPLSTRKLAVKFALINVIVVVGFLLVPKVRTEEKDQFFDQTVGSEQKSDPFFEKNKNNSLVIFDEADERYLIYNREGVHKRYSPVSTYKIWSAMFALDEKTIDRNNTIRYWDETKYPISTWNQDQNLQSALTNSTNWYFQQLDSELGKTTLKKKIKSINYGNMSLIGGINNFWLESSLKISPFEQLNLYRKLFKNELNFSTEDTALLKASLRLQTHSEYFLYGKTGTGKNIFGGTGWFLGSIETVEGDYYFACHLQGEGATGKVAARKTLSILKKLRYLDY
ncbi:BlaR1 family beta-lactam sensor/signal transducer [Enterococcus faecium]|nr:BlaR1 family beta-lactam sensor/signal transducer [Enterococcus faecium]